MTTLIVCRYQLFDSVLRYREMKNEKLMTTWVLLPNSEEDNDIEYEEDFKPPPPLPPIRLGQRLYPTLPNS